MTRPAIALLLALSVVAGAAGFLAWRNQQIGRQWQARALAAERDVERLVERSERLSDELADVRGALDASERDVGSLERRLAGLADEKAQAEDEREFANAAAERIAEIAGAYDAVATQFQVCRYENGVFTDMLAAVTVSSDTAEWAALTEQAATADAACAAAESRLDELRGYVDALS